VTDHDILVFLVAIALLLGVARVLGELARARGLPAVVGEIAAGLLLGPTVLGRIAPATEAWLFGPGPATSMISGYATIALVLLLVVAGAEVDPGVLRRRGRGAMAAGVLGIVLPAACGAALGWLLPGVPDAHRLPLTLILAVALGTSALPFVSRTLLGLGLLKSDVGLFVVVAAMIDDLVGWLALPLILGFARAAGDLPSFGRAVLAGAVLVAVVLVVGRRLLRVVLERLPKTGAASAGSVLALVVPLALLVAAAARTAGLHAILGGFVVGLALAGSARANARARQVGETVVARIFAPVFFASVGMRVDFVAAFDPGLCALVFVLASVPKILGCAAGARIGGLHWREATAVGFGVNARGATGIVIAAVALDAGLLRADVFVALVVMALGTSLVSEPVMKWLLYREEPDEDVVTLLRRGAFVPELHASTPGDAIAELARALGSLLVGRKRDARDAVLDRESLAPTGLGDEVAIPHAAIPGLERPLLAFGRAPHGIDFDAPDGRPARFVFLLLMPEKAYEEEVRILASIARATFDAPGRAELAAAADLDEVTRVLARCAKRTRKSMRPSVLVP
jgi:Kef-type K+ transport system membrane component KefB/mannitol/fructose-specific phosphotransferase system IIA component (Ntr-type)